MTDVRSWSRGSDDDHRRHARERLLDSREPVLVPADAVAVGDPGGSFGIRDPDADPICNAVADADSARRASDMDRCGEHCRTS